MALGIQRNMGLLLLSIWLILYGLSGLVALGLPAPLMAILALIAGVLILAGAELGSLTTSPAVLEDDGRCRPAGTLRWTPG